MIIPGLSSQLQKAARSYRRFPRTMKLVTANLSEGFFWNLQAYNASGTTDTAGNLAYHVQEPDP